MPPSVAGLSVEKVKVVMQSLLVFNSAYCFSSNWWSKHNSELEQTLPPWTVHKHLGMLP